MNSFMGLTSSYLHARNYLQEGVQSFCQYSLAFEEQLKVPRLYGCINIRSTAVFPSLLQKYYQFIISLVPGFISFPHSPKRKKEKKQNRVS